MTERQVKYIRGAYLHQVQEEAQAYLDNGWSVEGNVIRRKGEEYRDESEYIQTIVYEPQQEVVDFRLVYGLTLNDLEAAVKRHLKGGWVISGSLTETGRYDQNNKKVGVSYNMPMTLYKSKPAS